MKSLLLSLIAFGFSASAVVLDIELPSQGHYKVEISSTIQRSGCSGSVTELAVIYSSELQTFIAGRDLTQEPDNSSLSTTPGMFTCQAIVDYTTVAEFYTTTFAAKTISVDFPVSEMLGRPEIKVTKVGDATLQISPIQ